MTTPPPDVERKERKAILASHSLGPACFFWSSLSSYLVVLVPHEIADYDDAPARARASSTSIHYKHLRDVRDARLLLASPPCNSSTTCKCQLSIIGGVKKEMRSRERNATRTAIDISAPQMRRHLPPRGTAQYDIKHQCRSCRQASEDAVVTAIISAVSKYG